MKEPEVSIASDYAFLKTGEYYFYFGYEFDHREDEEVWGFEVKKNGASMFRREFDDTWKVRDKFACDECLLYGIGLYVQSKKK